MEIEAEPLNVKEVPLDAEDYEKLNSNKRWNVGCQVIFGILALAAVCLYLFKNIDVLVLGIALFICAALIALGFWGRKDNARFIKHGRKKVVTTPVKATRERLKHSGKSTAMKYYVVTPEKWTALGVSDDETEYEVKEELYKNLKKGDIIEVHKLPNDLFMKIVKIADAPPENT